MTPSFRTYPSTINRPVPVPLAVCSDILSPRGRPRRIAATAHLPPGRAPLGLAAAAANRRATEPAAGPSRLPLVGNWWRWTCGKARWTESTRIDPHFPHRDAWISYYQLVQCSISIRLTRPQQYSTSCRCGTDGRCITNIESCSAIDTLLVGFVDILTGLIDSCRPWFNADQLVLLVMFRVHQLYQVIVQVRPFLIYLFLAGVQIVPGRSCLAVELGGRQRQMTTFLSENIV